MGLPWKAFIILLRPFAGEEKGLLEIHDGPLGIDRYGIAQMIAIWCIFLYFNLIYSTPNRCYTR